MTVSNDTLLTLKNFSASVTSRIPIISFASYLACVLSFIVVVPASVSEVIAVTLSVVLIYLTTSQVVPRVPAHT